MCSACKKHGGRVERLSASVEAINCDILDNTRNGVGIILKKELVNRVMEVWRISDRVMYLKLELEGLMINIISAYAPQTVCPDEVEEAF